MSLDKSLHMWLKTLLATLLNGSVHTSHKCTVDCNTYYERFYQ